MTDTSDSIDINERSRKSWSEEEDNVLTKLVKKYGIKRWTDISKAMAELFELTGKSGKQCRQRWVNHLDPKINKEKWAIGEERRIFDAHKIHGNKWKVIAKELDNRTDNSIKNHFYSILRKGLRRLNKLIGDRKSTQKVKQIRTSVLSKLHKLQSSHQATGMNISNIYELLFQFSSMNSSNVSEKNLSDNIKQDLKEMIVHLTEISSKEKISKEKSVAINKNKRSRKSSQSEMVEEGSEGYEVEENESMKLNVEEKEERITAGMFTSATPVQNSLARFMINVDMHQRPREIIYSGQNQKYLIDWRTSQKAASESFPLSHQHYKPQCIQTSVKLQQHCQFTQNQKSEDFNLFPSITINIDDQSLSIAQSNDFTFNCFNKSPLFPSSRLTNHFNIRTPRVPSPGAFNLCGLASTAQSIGSFNVLNQKDGGQKSITFDCELDNIVQQLKSNIDANCNTLMSQSQQRVNSSRNSFIEPCLKNSSSIFLTPRSGEGKAH